VLHALLELALHHLKDLLRLVRRAQPPLRPLAVDRQLLHARIGPRAARPQEPAPDEEALERFAEEIDIHVLSNCRLERLHAVLPGG
jgi:hypothetical protein